jgi:hypothetical protein
VPPLSTENPNAVGARPLQPMLWARTQTGDELLVPFTGLATVMFDAKAAWAETTPEITARVERMTRRRAGRTKRFWENSMNFSYGEFRCHIAFASVWQQ